MVFWLTRATAPNVAPPTRRAVVGVVLVASLLAGMAGCGRSPEMRFTPSEAALELMPEVRDGMTVTDDAGQEVQLAGLSDVLAEHFGTPTKPVAWTLLPIDFGGTLASVAQVVSPSEEEADAAADEDRAIEQITFVVNAGGKEGVETLASVARGTRIGWTEGVYAGRSGKVVSFDPATNQLTLAGTFDDGLPDEGDALLVNPGAELVKGQPLYARHCLHCHGPGGAGDGPTAKYLSPKPRDFRLGKFKFTSTTTTDKASRDDLLTILKHGIPGTSMPAFRLLSEDELHALVEYVRWLTMRGEFEMTVAVTAAGGYELTTESYEERIADGDQRSEILEEVQDFLEYELVGGGIGEDLADAWSYANEPDAVVFPQTPRVPDSAESRARGRSLYLSDKAKCATCHGVYGKGDGPQAETFQENLRTKKLYPVPGLHDDWGNPLPPRDLTQGIYRGGRRPIDLYRRIQAGIKGTPMPAFGGSLSDEEIWDIVNYVLHVPYDDVPEPGQGTAIVSAGH